MGSQIASEKVGQTTKYVLYLTQHFKALLNVSKANNLIEFHNLREGMNLETEISFISRHQYINHTCNNCVTLTWQIFENM